MASSDLNERLEARSDFSDAYFARAELADLDRADLTRAVFISCRVRQANLFEVTSVGARFESCDLRDIKVSPDFQRMVTLDEVSQDSIRRPEDWEWPSAKPGIVEIANVNITRTIEPEVEI